ncbi:MAG: hypothetical protein O2888_05320 [Chloroflexi bacterium]|nr:hypothetical protein [Chloroflexota bacterium]
MANINIQQFYSDIVSRGRRNVPTYAEARRDADEAATLVRTADSYRA